MISLFYMWTHRRKNLIEQHKFYVSEGKNRITNQFNDPSKLKREAYEYAHKWLRDIGEKTNGNDIDIGDIMENAHEISIDFYMALEQMGNYARLGLVSGMYHLWEKSLKEWLTSNDGILHWHTGDKLQKKIWNANFEQIFELFECAGLFSDGEVRKGMDIARMVVNTYKHGRGESFFKLKKIRKDMFDDYLVSLDDKYEMSTIDYDDLYIKDEHIDEISSYIVRFWQEIPEHIFDSNFEKFPKWFENALRDGVGKN